ncbi:hypothetical protein C2845_PM03G07670 [Panicum miliaceum]|uniref:Transmembrane protein 135 N-terminal domain-containing protein n=1 Tax=Panicum miliaceum TaxID=4540 RepID=A0A3L6TAB9_PANMI|nr:hypothetical protein C2845_PM03G07670 [Panicum miliaceum]
MPFLSTPSFDLSAGAEPTLGPRPPVVPPPPPTPAAAGAHHHHHHQPPVSEATARRLREAEERLREAIEELHRHQGGAGKGEGEEQREGEWGCGHEGESCAAHAAGNLCQSFLLSYGVRVGIGILLRAFKLARRRYYGSLLDLKCAYNSAKSKNKFHFWGSHWRHGDALLFSLASAQVMYTFVMRPESLPKSYQEFILKTGPVAEPVYKVVRECCRGGPVDLTALSTYLSNKRNSDLINLTTNPSIIPCSVIHPDRASCLAQNVNVVSSTFKKTFSLYFSLTFVPFVVLRLQKFLESPAATSWRALVGAVRSTTFLSAFVTLFQLQTKTTNLCTGSGLMSGLSILLENKARRAELALYVLPCAGDSLWYILINRHLLPNIKNAEVALFCMCILEYEPDTMAPFLRGLIRRFLASKISNPSPPPNRNTSYSYLQTLNALEQSRTQPGVDNGPPTSEKYNLESIPGL